jgi:AcrR family transcriptional regulator
MALRPASPEGDTRQQILQRAITLFAGAGYADVSVRDVAAQVGISAAALYHHFPDKQALYLAAMEHAFARNESDILAALESERSPLERLSGFVTGFVALAAGRRGVQQAGAARTARRRRSASRIAGGARLPPSARGHRCAGARTGPGPGFLHAGRFRDRAGAVQFPDRSAAALPCGRVEPPERPEDIARHVMTLLTRVFVRQDAP